MATSPITLAALATSAVSGLQVTGYRAFNESSAEEQSVILESSEGDVLVQLPTTPSAEVHHSAKILGQAALTSGVREQLPFEAPRVLGMTRSHDTRAIVSTFVHGDRFAVEDLGTESFILDSLAEVLSAIHAIPLSAVRLQGLRVRSTDDARLDAKTIIDRASKTGMLPAPVSQVWNEQLSNLSLWEFHPTVTHGSFSEDTLLITDDLVTGVLDWAELSIGDPAIDFAWLAGADPGVLEQVTELYVDLYSANSVATLVTRAKFWHELDVARWLLHGVEQRDEAIIADAVELLDNLVSYLSVEAEPLHHPSGLAAAQAAAKPDSVPHSYSDTSRYDMLDEDRDFSQDRDFLTEEITDLTDSEDSNDAPSLSSEVGSENDTAVIDVDIDTDEDLDADIREEHDSEPVTGVENIDQLPKP